MLSVKAFVNHEYYVQCIYKAPIRDRSLVTGRLRVNQNSLRNEVMRSLKQLIRKISLVCFGSRQSKATSKTRPNSSQQTFEIHSCCKHVRPAPIWYHQTSGRSPNLKNHWKLNSFHGCRSWIRCQIKTKQNTFFNGG